jgi:class 3 adenylate cyclase/tetratricopeptide (TPR) repeat protein
MTCPRCAAESPAGARFCAQCGSLLVPRCSACQAELPAGARFCAQCGQPAGDAPPPDDARLARLAAATPAALADKLRAVHLSGERRLVTVLFADVVGSTGLAEQLDAEDWAALMNGLFDRVSPVIYRYEGTIAQLLGDGLLVFFGAPIAHEDDAVRAVHAALGVLDIAGAYAVELRRRHGVEFALRIGLNTGRVVVGPVSSDLRFEYVAMGDAVHLAARIQSAAHPMTALLSGNTYRFIAPVFECTDLGLLEIKGKSTPTRVFQVRSARATPARGRGPFVLESPLVGRDAELAALQQLGAGLRAGQGRVAVIAGEPGVGKTRLIAEWRARAEHANEITWASGHCLSYGQGLAYHLVHDVLRSLLGLPPGASEHETAAALRALTGELFAGDAAEVYRDIAALLALETPAHPLEAQVLQSQGVIALRRLLHALAARNPLALVLDDVHWADPSSTEVLIRLLPLAAEAPLLFCIVTRADRDAPGWRLVVAAREAADVGLTEITLTPLSGAASRQLVANLLDMVQLPADIHDLILRKAEGNPLFVEEVIRMLVDQHTVLGPDEGGITWQASAIVQIPDNLQGLLLARIDRLPEDAKPTLRVASVIGRRFDRRLLERVLEKLDDASALAAHLGTLENAGLIRPAQTGQEPEYLFRHVLVQEAAYASLLRQDRRHLHQLVGDVLEEMFPQRREELAPRLAQHFYEAGDARALHYFASAAAAALAAYANPEAERYYRAALTLAHAPAARAPLLDGLGLALAHQDREREAVDVWQEAIALYQALDDGEHAAWLYARAARAASDGGDQAGSVALCRAGLAALTGRPETAGTAALLQETARAAFHNEQFDEALPFSRQALALAERLGAADVQAEALTTLSIFQPPDEALAGLTRAVALAEAHGLTATAARAHNSAGHVLERLGEFDAARERYGRAVGLARRMGSPVQEHHYRANAVRIALWRAEFDAAAAALPELRRLGGDHMPGTLFVEAMLHRFTGRLDEACAELRACHDETHARHNVQLLGFIQSCLADALLEQGALDEAEAVLEHAIGHAAHGVAWGGVWLRALLVALRARQGRLDGAGRALDEARVLAGFTPGRLDLEHLELATARLAAARDEWDAALAAYARAADAQAAMGRRWYRAATLREWAAALRARRAPGDEQQARALEQEAGGGPVL